MRAVLFGGPCAGRTLNDVPPETEYMDILGPPKDGQPQYAHYKRVGDELGRARFDFTGIHTRSSL